MLMTASRRSRRRTPARRSRRGGRRPFAAELLALLARRSMLPADRHEHQHGDQHQCDARGQQHDLAAGDDDGHRNGADAQHQNDDDGDEYAEAIAAVAFFCVCEKINRNWSNNNHREYR